MRFLITLCTYNERENVRTLVPEVCRCLPGADLLIVDDNSPDGTGSVALELGQEFPQVRLLSRAEKSGLGAATLAGFQEAIRQQYDFVINMDADWSHPPDVLPKLAAVMNAADVAIASRYISGGGIEGWSLSRHLMSRGINWYTRLLLGVRAHDASGAYRCYRIAKLAELDFTRWRSRGYAFQEEMLYRCQRLGCRFEEVPFVFVDRAVGASKINFWEIVRALKDIALLAVDRIRGVPVARSKEH